MDATRTAVVGVFEHREQARKAVEELLANSFPEDRIGLAVRDTAFEITKEADTATAAEDGAITGAIAGAGVGGLWAVGIAVGLLPAIGPVIAGGIFASILASAAGGAAMAGIVGALVGMGIPEEEARFYESEFRTGRTIVTVSAVGRYEEAVTILRRNGAYDMHSQPIPEHMEH